MQNKSADPLDTVIPEAIRKVVDSGDRELAWTFFVIFSRMECALKRCKYLKGAAAADWGMFASEHDEAFNKESVGDAVAYFLKNPPRKQIIDDNDALGWSEPQNYDNSKPLLAWLLLMIRCTRNNLLHGGKYPLIPISEPSRDRDLLLYSISVLLSVMELSPDVKRYFFENLTDQHQ